MMRAPGFEPRHTGSGSGHFIGTGELINSAAGGNIALSGGVLAGDIAIAISAGAIGASELANVIVNGPAGTGYHFKTSWVILSAGDQAAQNVNLLGGGPATTLIGVYRGPTTPTTPNQGFNDTTTSSPVICPGIAKNAGCQALAYFVGSPNNPTLGAGPGTLRHVTSDGLIGLADFDPASLYTNGTPEQWAYTTLSNILLVPFDLH